MTNIGVLCPLVEGSRCPSPSCSLTSSFKAVNLGFIIGHCSTQISLSESQDRPLGSGTKFLRACGGQ